MLQVHKLLADQGLFSDFIEFVPCPLVLAEWEDDFLHIRHLNRAFVDELGYQIEDIPDAGVWWKKAYPDPEYRQKIRGDWMRNIESLPDSGTQEVTIKAFIRTAHRGDRWFELTATIWKKIQIVALIDLDDLEQRNRQLKALNTAKDNLLSVLSHDVRGPLKRIQSLLSLMKEGHVSETELKVHLGSLTEEVNYAAQTIDQTLDWVKGSQEDKEGRFQWVALEDLIKQVHEAHQYLARRKDITLTMGCDASKVWMDPEIVRITVWNLVNNALKFTPRLGKVHIACKPDKEGVEIAVEDTGKGMDAQQIENILGKAGYTEQGTEAETGTGIGLSIVRNLAREHGLRFSVESKVQEGSRFSLWFPKEAAS